MHYRKLSRSKLILAIVAVLCAGRPGCEAQALYGDANTNRVVDSADLSVVVDTLLGRRSMPGSGTPPFINMDLDGNGLIQIADRNLLGDYLLGRLLQFPADRGAGRPWHLRNIGTSDKQRHPDPIVTISGGTYTFLGSGLNLQFRRDMTSYLFQKSAGDLDVIARVDLFGVTSSGAGLMIRDSLRPDARCVAISAVKGNTGFFNRRTTNTVNMVSTWLNAPAAPRPLWLKIARRGNQVEGSCSADGSNWSTWSDTVSMDNDVYVGLRVSGFADGVYATGTFDNVSITPTVAITNPTYGARFVAPASIQITAQTAGSIAKVEFFNGTVKLGEATSQPYQFTWNNAPMGWHFLTAKAHRTDASTSTSAKVFVNVGGNTPALPAGVPDIFDASGLFDPGAYRNIATNLSTVAGISYRYGPAYSYYHPVPETFPTWWKPADQYNPYGNGGAGNWYQVGGPPVQAPGDYSSTGGQALYIPDHADYDPGVDRLDILSMAHMVFTEQPGPHWWTRSHPDAGVDVYPAGIRGPVSIARAYGTLSNNGLIIFNNGVFGSMETPTSHRMAMVGGQFPANKVPTSVTLTSNNEFGLVTIWDTTNLKGQLAIISLGSEMWPGQHWNREWYQNYPGFISSGLFSFMKILGYIDLPGMVAPTEVSAATDFAITDTWLSDPATGANRQKGELDLNNETVRQSFVDGYNDWKYAKAGYAIVISKSEKKALFIDLQPLFQFYQKMYFTTRANWDATRIIGQAAHEWPYTFDHSPEQIPTVAKVFDLPDRPTAVLAGLHRSLISASETRGCTYESRAYVATMDGQLFVFEPGNLATTDPLDEEAIQPVMKIQVGRNPTCLTHRKQWALKGPENALENHVIVVSRGDQKVEWVEVDFNSRGGSIYKTLQDSRIVDMISAEDADNHGTASSILSIADFGGKQVLNYRYGPIVFHTNGGARYDMGPDGTAEFEFGGSMSFTGYVFRVSGTDLP